MTRNNLIIPIYFIILTLYSIIDDVIKMPAIVLLMYTYKTSYLKQYLRENLLLETNFRLYLTDWTSNNTKKMCFIFFRLLESSWGPQIDKFDPDSITFVVIL